MIVVGTRAGDRPLSPMIGPAAGTFQEPPDHALLGIGVPASGRSVARRVARRRWRRAEDDRLPKLTYRGTPVMRALDAIPLHLLGRTTAAAQPALAPSSMAGISVMSGPPPRRRASCTARGWRPRWSADVPSGDRIVNPDLHPFQRWRSQNSRQSRPARARRIGIATSVGTMQIPGLGNERHALGNAPLHLGDGHASGHRNWRLPASGKVDRPWDWRRRLSPATGEEGLTGRCRRV